MSSEWSAEPENASQTEQTLQSKILEQYVAYPFDTDPVYQQGLAAILLENLLEKNPSPEAQQEILRRTRVFYFNKITGNSLTTDQAREYELSHRRSEAPLNPREDGSAAGSNVLGSPTISDQVRADAASTMTTKENENADEPRVLTFAEIEELIRTGRLDQIPNNKHIPDALNEATPSQATAPPRRKPWEIVLEETERMTAENAAV